MSECVHRDITYTYSRQCDEGEVPFGDKFGYAALGVRESGARTYRYCVKSTVEESTTDQMRQNQPYQIGV